MLTVWENLADATIAAWELAVDYRSPIEADFVTPYASDMDVAMYVRNDKATQSREPFTPEMFDKEGFFLGSKVRYRKW
jgi:hypothetical protein